MFNRKYSKNANISFTAFYEVPGQTQPKRRRILAVGFDEAKEMAEHLQRAHPGDKLLELQQANR